MGWMILFEIQKDGRKTMDLLSPLEGLFGLLASTGLIVLILGRRRLQQAFQSLRHLPPPQAHTPNFQLATRVSPFQLLGLLIPLLAVWLICGLFIPLFLAKTSWSDQRIESVNLIIQALGFQAIGLTLIARTLRASDISWRSLLSPDPVGVNLGRALMAYLMLIPPLFLVSALNEAILSGWGYPISFQTIVDAFQRMGSVGMKSLLIFAIVGIAPLFEELLFRGLLFPWLTGRLGWAGGILASSALFSLVHFHLPSAAPLALLGIALCLLYTLTDRLILCVFVHMLFNSINIFAITLWTG